MAGTHSQHRLGVALIVAAVAWSTAPFFTRLLPSSAGLRFSFTGTRAPVVLHAQVEMLSFVHGNPFGSGADN